MKKLFISALLACTASVSFAQDAVKQVMAATDYQEALNLLNSSLSSMSNEDKAKAYSKVAELAVKKFNKESEVALTNQVAKQNNPYDKEGMNAAAIAAMNAALECDKYDQMPNEKGKVKPKFRSKMAQMMAPVRASLINAGQDEYNEKDFAGATNAFGMYIETSTSPLFKLDMGVDPYLTQIAYFASLSAYNAQNYTLASKYATTALQDTAFANDALDIKVLSMKAMMKTKADSVNYFNEIKALYDSNPSNERFFGLLNEYYSATGDNAAKASLIQAQVANNPGSKMAWALKGESEMNDRKWADAIESYKKSIEIDPEFIQVMFNLAVCYNSKAIEFKDEVSDKRTGMMTPENDKKFKEDLQQSVNYLLKVKEKDPNREMIKWAYPLYQAYFLLGDEAKANEIESLLK